MTAVLQEAESASPAPAEDLGSRSDASRSITDTLSNADDPDEHSSQQSRAIQLHEYTRQELKLSEEQASKLNLLGNGRYLSVAPSEQSGHWQVSARNYVGSVNAAGLQVLVKPKIPLQNLFLLLEVGLREQDWHHEAVNYETTADLLPAMISWFARTTETCLARGLYHSYREQRDRLIALRGRVDIARQFTQPGMVIPTACRFTEFTADVIENSYLKAAVSRSLKVPGVQPIDRHRLMQQLVTLEEAAEQRHHHSDHDQITFTRLNEHYKPALNLARLILANLTLQDDIGDTQSTAFMLDMNELFERFVTERLTRALRGRLEVKSQHVDRLDTYGAVTIRPDLVFQTAGKPRFVADIKYKLADDNSTGTHADLYQLLAYTTALDVTEGLLIYCLDANSEALGNKPRVGLGAQPVQVKHAGKLLHTYALDLSGDAKQIADQLQALANWIAKH